MSSQLLSGQRSIHFSKESVRRRKIVISAIEKVNPQIVMVRALTKETVETRMLLIREIVNVAVAKKLDFLTFDLDETTLFKDRLVLKLETIKLKRQIFWDHKMRHEEPLLWVADAVAWCVNRGGEWERMVRPMIVETIDC